MPAAEVLTVEIVKFVHALLVSIPQYVLGSLSAIAILGATPVGEISSVILNYKLFGWNTKIMELTPEQKELMKGCVAEASILDRLSYMIVGKIIVKDSPMDRRYNIIETGLFSIIAPWLAVILAYFTNPIGYGSFMLLSLVLLSSSRPLWVKIFGDLCADPTTPCLSMSDIVNK
ncbi:8102_t:CDS:2 [Entrophospora sp. SA101]|nr:8102_t:CDS:2 [Entrophospora sp. SA101]